MTINELKQILIDNKTTILNKLLYINSNHWQKFGSCEQINYKNDFINILRIMSINLNDFENMRKEIYKEWPPYKILKSIFIQAYVVLIKLSYDIDREMCKQFYIMFGINTHYSLLKKYIKFCKPNVFQLALEHLPGQHLFNQKESIQGAFYYILEILFNRWIDSVNSDKSYVSIYRIMYDFRTRWNQSMQSLSSKYYDIINKKIKIINISKEEFLIDDKVDNGVDKLVFSIKTYHFIDKHALKLASNKINLRETYLLPIIKLSENLKSEILKEYIYLIVNNKSSDELKTAEAVAELLKRMSTRYTKQKNSLKEWTEKIIQLSIKTDEETSINYNKLSMPYKQKIRIGIMLYFYLTLIKNI